VRPLSIYNVYTTYQPIPPFHMISPSGNCTLTLYEVLDVMKVNPARPISTRYEINLS